ncbi:MAG: hypothetical protein IJJ26_03255 [Victivallales bacterium]|nr:hypothetical protein [Victivallales bacterium]
MSEKSDDFWKKKMEVSEHPKLAMPDDTETLDEHQSLAMSDFVERRRKTIARYAKYREAIDQPP